MTLGHHSLGKQELKGSGLKPGHKAVAEFSDGTEVYLTPQAPDSGQFLLQRWKDTSKAV